MRARGENAAKFPPQLPFAYGVHGDNSQLRKVTPMNIPSVKAPVIEARLSHQAARIEQGIKSGSLTAKEAKALVAQQKDIYQDLRQAKKDNGFVGPHERRELRQELRQSSLDIFLAKHNGTER